MEEPTIIENHRVLSVLGRGAGGVVYKVESIDTGEALALKLLAPSASHALIERLRFEREFRLISNCDHPFLTRAIQYGHFQDRPFYTMSLVEGVNFRTRFEELRNGEGLEALAKVCLLYTSPSPRD